MKFRKELSILVGQIPEGKVSTYGDIARSMGDVIASKTVYNLLQDEWDGGIPVHRVVTAGGEPGISRFLQTLKEEGISVENGRVKHIAKFLFRDFKSKQVLVKLREEQDKLASQVSLKDGFKTANTVGGVDVAYKGDRAFAACMILDLEEMKVVEKRRLSGKASFPYVSTYLSYRELPMIKKIFRRLKTKPDVLMVDGNGILHPRKIGIASHAGLELDIPTIGVTKRLLLGKLGKTPKKIGDFAGVIHEGAVLGMALKSSKSDRYVYISPGHMISMKSALELSRKVCFHRIPEPIRRAHRMASELKKYRTK